MPAHLNFYENIKEAHIRLHNTVVMYDSLPYYVIAITNHHGDGIFRIYLQPLGDESVGNCVEGPFEYTNNLHREDPALGAKLDSWMASYPNAKTICLRMNSPLFNKYRPFPLGMCNYGPSVFYMERQPTRKTEQGLTVNSVAETRLSLTGQVTMSRRGSITVNFTGEAMRSCIIGDHPSIQDCVSALMSDKFQNEGLAFHRDFALLKGPIDLLFLAYKNDIIGVLPKSDLSFVKLDPKYIHAKEVVEKLALFEKII